MAEGLITRQDIITDSALEFGKEYKENIEIILEANKQIKESAKEVFEIYKGFDKISTQEQFIEAKRKETLATLEAKNAIKLQEEALKSAEKIKREVLKTDQATVKSQQNIADQARKTSTAWKEQDQAEKSLISTKRKNELASESTNRALIKEREELRKQNLEIKRSLTFVGQLTSKRDQARKSIQEYQAKLALGKKLSDQEQRELRESTVEFKKYNKAIKIIKESTGQFQENVGNYPKLFKSLGSGLRQLLPVLGVAGSLRLVFGAIKDATDIIRDFDRQMIAVQKTTGLTDGEMFKLRKEVISLGVELKGVSIQGLSEAAEVAGQLGVKGTKNILGFAKAIEILKVSAKGISEETVADFAKFIEVSKDSAENADRLSSVITTLGNNFATTEKEVIKSATEIQKGVQIYKVSAEQVLGLAGATSALGIQDAAARTSIRKTYGVIQQAIFTGKNLKEVLELTGLTEKELAEQFEKDATGTFIKFLKGLNEMTEGGENTQLILEKMKLAGDRVAPTLLSLSSKNELVADAVNRSTEEYITNTAALQEAELAAKSLDSLLGDLKDSWSGLILGLEDGDNALGRLAKTTLRGLSEGIDKFSFALRDDVDVLDKWKIAANNSTRVFSVLLPWVENGTGLFQESTDKLIADTKARDNNAKAIQDQVDGFIELYGSIGPLLKNKENPFDFLNAPTEATDDSSDAITRNVAFLREQIKAQKDLLELTTTKEEAQVIQASIDGYNKELEAILGVKRAKEKQSKVEEDAYNLSKEILQQRIEDEKEILKNKEESAGERLSANLDLFIQSKNLLDLEKEQAINNAKGRVDEIKRIELRYSSDLEALEKQRSDNSNGVLEDEFSKVKVRLENKKRIEQEALDAETGDLQEQLLRKEITVKEYEDRITKIKRDAAVKILEDQIGFYEEELKNPLLDPEQRILLEQALAGTKISLSNLVTDNFIADAKAQEEAEKKLQEFRKQAISDTSDVIAEALGLDSSNIERFLTGITEGFENAFEAIQASVSVAGELIGSLFDAKAQRYEEDIQRNSDYYTALLDNQELSEEQRSALEAEKDQKEAEIEKKKRESERKAAIFSKAANIVEVGIDTARKVAAIKTQAAVLASNPFTLPAVPLALAQIPLVLGFGALAIAAIAAKPIPKYFKGTENHPGGLAEVAEYRPEVIHEPGKDPYLQKKRGVLDLPEGTKVYPSLDDYVNMEMAQLESSFGIQNKNLVSYGNLVSVYFNTDELVGEMRENTKATKNLKLSVSTHRAPDISHLLYKRDQINWK